MKIFFTLSVITASVLVSGCVTGRNPLTLDTVGPAKSSTVTVTTGTNGILVVYSAFCRNADFNSRDPYRQEYSNYEIFSSDGQRLRFVRNNSGGILYEAEAITLPAGKYQIKARANGCGFLSIPVIIAAQQSTILHLEGGGFWPDESIFNQTNAVRLPDGGIIGMKATADEQH